MSDETASTNTEEFAITADEEERQLRLEQLAADFIERGRHGERATIAEYQRQYPELANDLAELFPAIAKLEGLKLLDQSSSRRAVVGMPAMERLGDFRIIREIGRGGMGVVFEAEQETLHRRVALKVLGANVAATADHFARFRREAEAAARLHHTNIVPVYGSGEDQGVHFYAMQFIEGWTLDEVIAALSGTKGADPVEDHRSTTSKVGVSGALPSGSSSRQVLYPPSLAPPSPPVARVDSRKLAQEPVVRDLLNPRVAANMAADLADAVAYAHSQGVIHRDIKPGNVILDCQGVAWLVDFGLAKHDEKEPLTQTGHVVGTVQYMSPEQFSGECHEQSDVHSLGLTLYELLSLKPAYATSNQVRLIQQKSSTPPAPLRNAAPQVPRDLETIVMKACAVAREHRYSSAAAFAADLRRFIKDEPILARRTTPMEKAWRWSRRHRGISVLLVTTVVLMLALLTSLAVGKSRTEKALTDMGTQKRLAQENLGMAVEALDAIMANVSARGVSQTLRLETVAGETQFSNVAVTAADADMLKTLLQFYDRFARGNSANLDAESARAEAQIGEIEAHLGHLDRAEAAYERAAERFRRVRADARNDEGLLLAEVNVLNQLATVRAGSGDIRGALATHFDAQREITSFSGASAAVRFALARTLLESCTVGRTAGAREIFAGIVATGGGSAVPPPSPDDRPRRPDGNPIPWQTIEDAFNQSSELLRGLVTEDPSNPEYRLTLAQCELDRREFSDLPGHILKPLLPASAAEAESLLRQLVQQDPNVPRYRFELAKALTTRCRLKEELIADQQEEYLIEAIDLTQRLQAGPAQNSAYHLLMAQAKHQLAGVLKSQGRTTESVTHFQEALHILRQLAQESPTSAFHHVALAQMLVDWSGWQREAGQIDEARQSLQEALNIAEKTAPSWGDDRIFERFLSQLRIRVESPELQSSPGGKK